MKRSALALLFCTLAMFAIGSAFYFQVEGQHHRSGSGPGESGPMSNATVSFGAWMTNPAIDRFPNSPPTQFPRFNNLHELAPEMATIKAGGTVNFIIGGLHVIAIYDDGARSTDINATLLTPMQGGTAFPPVINDPNRRIYRGLDPSLLPARAQQDRVEVVHFDRPGTYLVICAVLPHFADRMYGYVRVLPGGPDSGRSE